MPYALTEFGRKGIRVTALYREPKVARRISERTYTPSEVLRISEREARQMTTGWTKATRSTIFADPGHRPSLGVRERYFRKVRSKLRSEGVL